MEDLNWINKEELSKLEEIWRIKISLKNSIGEKKEKINNLANYRLPDNFICRYIIEYANAVIPSAMKFMVIDGYIPEDINAWSIIIKENKTEWEQRFEDKKRAKPLSIAILSLTCAFLILLIVSIIGLSISNNQNFLFCLLACFIILIVDICLFCKRVKDREFCAKQLNEIREYNFDKLINNAIEASSSLKEYFKLNSEINDCEALLNDAKSKFNTIPKKYIDYVSEYDGVPAIFRFIEIIEDRRANSIKELIDTYLNDEFKKGEMIRLGNMEAVLQNQQYEFRKSVQEQQKMMKEMKYNVEQRLKEIKNSIEDIDVLVDVRVTE